MAGSMWLKIDGCEGEATDDGHQKEIDVSSWQWGMAHALGPRGGGGSSGETSSTDLIVMKQIDKASPNLMKFCFNAKHFPEILLTVRKRGENPIDYLKLKMKGALIANVSVSGAADSPGMESVGFHFDAVEVEYTPQDDKGKAQGAVTFKWDLKKNKEG
jgi:type VI secretion system secreted protein Hcp